MAEVDTGNADDERPKAIQDATSTPKKETDAAPVLTGCDCLKALKEFTSSGLFFMIVGVAMLLWANSTMGKTHSTLSFFLVVIGSAILLFGTGTQAFGQASGEQLAKYTLTLAGGAGALAFAIAIGVVLAQKPIRDAFHAERQYLKLPVEVETDGQSNIDGYIAEAFVGNVAVATSRPKRKSIEIFVPFLPGETDVPVTLELLSADPKSTNPDLKLEAQKSWTIDPTNSDSRDGAFDLSSYNWSKHERADHVISVRKPASELTTATGSRVDKNPPDRPGTNFPEPAVKVILSTGGS